MSVLSNLEKAALADLDKALGQVKALYPLLEGEALAFANSMLNAALPSGLRPVAQVVEQAIEPAASNPTPPSTPEAGA